MVTEAEQQLVECRHFIDYIGEVVGVPKAPHTTSHCFDILAALKEIVEQRCSYAVDALNCHQALWGMLKAYNKACETREQTEARNHAMKCLPKLQ